MRTVPNFSASADHTSTPRSDSDRALSVLLLAAAVAALAVTVNQLMDTWAEDQLLTAWVALWAVVFAGSLLLAGTARQTQSFSRNFCCHLARRQLMGRYCPRCCRPSFLSTACAVFAVFCHARSRTFLQTCCACRTDGRRSPCGTYRRRCVGRRWRCF